MMKRWRSFWDGFDRAPLRWSLVVIALAEYAGQAYQVSWQSRNPQFEAPFGVGAVLGAIPGATWILWIVIAVALVRFGRDRRPIASAIVALLAARTLMRWQQEVFASPARNSFIPGAALLGWIAGEAWVRERARVAGSPEPGRAERDRAGEAGVLGVLAAVYAGSAISKLSASGLGWADGQQVRALILLQDSLFPGRVTDAFRALVVENAYVSRALNFGTLIVEGGAVALLGPRWLRLGWAALIFGMHIGIIALCGMLYFEPMLMLLVFVVPWPQLLRRTPSGPTSFADAEPLRSYFPPRVIIAIVAFLALYAAVSPFGWRPPGV